MPSFSLPDLLLALTDHWIVAPVLGCTALIVVYRLLFGLPLTITARKDYQAIEQERIAEHTRKAQLNTVVRISDRRRAG